MRRSSQIALSLLVCLMLLMAMPLPEALADDQLTWDIPYNYYSTGSGYPQPDYLPEYLGLARADLTADTSLQVSLTPQGEVYDLTATITIGERKVQFTGQGSYGPWQQSPVQSGEFICQTDAGVACKLYLQVYATGNEQRVTLLFGENTPKAATVAFGQPEGNISAINSQVTDRLKNQAKLPTTYQLDGQSLTLEPAPLIVDNHVLVPVRPLLTALGARVTWEGSTQTITAAKGNTILSLSLAKQTQQLNGEAAEPAVLYRAPGGQIFGQLESMAEAFGATVFVRRDNTVGLISYEQTLAQQGILQFIFVSSQNVIIQNDTNRPFDLGGWSLICTDPSQVATGMAEFRFPEQFTLQPGQQVQVSGQLTTEPDGKVLFDWNQSAGVPAGPARMMMMVSSMQPGEERVTLQSLGADQYLGNWRLVNTAGKPAFDFPDDIWVAKGQNYTVNGLPGQPANANELRWSNLPDIEEAYQTEQAELAKVREERHEQLITLYAPVTEALGLTDQGYHFYSELEADGLLLEGGIAPFEGKRDASRALLFVKMGLIEPSMKSGNNIPVYYVGPDGQTAYVAMIKQDGTMIAYRLQRVIDQGFYTWTHEQVLPK